MRWRLFSLSASQVPRGRRFCSTVLSPLRYATTTGPRAMSPPEHIRNCEPAQSILFLCGVSQIVCHSTGTLNNTQLKDYSTVWGKIRGGEDDGHHRSVSADRNEGERGEQRGRFSEERDSCHTPGSPHRRELETRNTSWHTIIGKQVAITTDKENPVKNELVEGKVLWRSWGANGGHLAEQSRRVSSLSVTVLGGLWYGRMFATDNSGLEGGRTLPCLCLAVTQFTTESLSVTQVLPQRERLEKPVGPTWTSAQGKAVFTLK